MEFSIQGIAGASGRHPWLTILAWLIVIAAAAASSSMWVAEALDGQQGPTQTLEYERARELINERFGELDGTGQDEGAGESEETFSELVLFVGEGIGPGDQVFDGKVQEFVDGVNAAQADAGVQLLSTDWTNYPSQPSQDGTSLLVFAEITGDGEENIGDLIHVAEEVHSDNFNAYLIGFASTNHTFAELAESDLVTGESIGIAVALIILALVFGSVVAAFVPIVLAIFAIFVAVGLTPLVAQFVELNDFVPNIMTMMGLAVGIDYSLFILSRYKEERARGLDKHAAIEASGGTAGRAVVFSGFTVVLALLGMLIIPERTFQAFGVGAIMVVFVAVIVGMTLLPALIGLLGDRVWAVKAPLPLTLGLFIVGAIAVGLTAGVGPLLLVVSIGVMLFLTIMTLLKPFTGASDFLGMGGGSEYDPDTEEGIANAVTVNVMRRPWLSMAVATVFLLVLGYFYFELDKGTSGISVLPDDEPAKQGFVSLNEKFGFGSDAPTIVAVDGNVGSADVEAAIDRLEAAINADSGLVLRYPDESNPGIAPPIRIEPSVNLASISAVLPGDPTNQDALQTVRRLRSELVPEAFAGVADSEYEVFVGGDTAEIVDSVKVSDEYLPIVFASVLSLSFILLLLAFRSITISIASIIMNLLSVGAAYGLVVLVFQKGFLIDFFGFEKVDQIEFWLPLFMFSILFGLSMDYHVFMLSRIKERYDITGLASESVAFGLRTTASIITGAALIMVAVFGGFALGDIAFFQSMGFGLGAAVLLDATVVRSLLVPSVMRVMGPSAWYLPSWLEWIPNISIEGQSHEASGSEPAGTVPSGASE